MKKLISSLVAIVMVLSSFSTAAYAVDYDTPIDEVIVEEYAIFNTIESLLSISGNTATCASVAAAGNAQSITATQKLQRYSGWFWFWDDVATWTGTQNYASFLMGNSISGLSSGKYRVVTVFTVTSTSGQTETATAYSVEATVS